MFDRTVNFPAVANHANPQAVTVHEHAAPTADSIRLAEEFRERTIDQVLSEVLATLPENEISGVVIEYSPMLRQRRIGFRLNGRTHSVTIYEEVALSENPAAALVNALAEEIAKVLTAETLRTLSWRRS
jgi:hypothetical protein